MNNTLTDASNFMWSIFHACLQKDVSGFNKAAIVTCVWAFIRPFLSSAFEGIFFFSG
jgi:hypothetical protein